MAQGVDESVKRSAMKKLFTNPHFNIMDGLDIYIGDYNTFEPISPALLASLNHAKALLDPLSQLQAPLMNLLKLPAESGQAAPDADPSVPALDHVPADTEQEAAATAALSGSDANDDDAEQPEHQELHPSEEPNATPCVRDV
jgi:hypothetical protein